MSDTYPPDPTLMPGDEQLAAGSEQAKIINPNYIMIPLGDMTSNLAKAYDFLFERGELCVLRNAGGLHLERVFGAIDSVFEEGIVLSTGLGLETFLWGDIHLLEPGADVDSRREAS